MLVNLNFGDLKNTEGDWWIEVCGVIRKRENAIPWTKEEMLVFWAQVCKLMRAIDVTNRYPLVPIVKLVRSPKHKRKRILPTANHGLQLDGHIRKLKGEWGRADCENFREEITSLMRDVGLILERVPVVYVLTYNQDQKESVMKEG